MLWYLLAFSALLVSAQGRAVNISNTWVLPEEGFPVFYRYFRDRISWYEADAVCQFHHANLVTVDTTAQYDAVRAYLKELDISSAVWIGLIRSNPDGDFTWTDYRGLSGDGYWNAAPDARAAPLCAAANPAADYRWEAMACGGPTVTSFICELPVPQWALGNEGCMVRALPALTILYLPESAAVQLTTDCGMADVKRVQCTGNVKREDLLKDLSCSEDSDIINTTTVLSSSTNWLSTNDDQENSNEMTTGAATVTTEHEDNSYQTSTIKARNASSEPKLLIKNEGLKDSLSKNTLNPILIEKNINLAALDSNNQLSNFIPKIANEQNFITDEHLEKLEDEKHMQHKMLHEQFAKYGNFDNIFTQPTDHFVPPLVMAKAKIFDDMTVLSLAEKHAQQLAEQHFPKVNVDQDKMYSKYDRDNQQPNPTKFPAKVDAEKPLIISLQTKIIDESIKKDTSKSSVPKKYTEKYNDSGSKIFKASNTKFVNPQKETLTTESYFSPTVTITKEIESTTTTSTINYEINQNEKDHGPNNDGPVIDLTVTIKEKQENKSNITLFTNNSDDVAMPGVMNNKLPIKENLNITDNKKEQKLESKNNSSFNHEVINITIPVTYGSTFTATVFEITTITPILHDTSKTNLTQFPASVINLKNLDNSSKGLERIYGNNTIFNIMNTDTASNIETLNTKSSNKSSAIKPDIKNETEITVTEHNIISQIFEHSTTPSHVSEKDVNITKFANDYNQTSEQEIEDFNFEHHEFEIESKTTDVSEIIDDSQSPLLSGASEPLPRPNRSRRPQQQVNRNKFNPFRILG